VIATRLLIPLMLLTGCTDLSKFPAPPSDTTGDTTPVDTGSPDSDEPTDDTGTTPPVDTTDSGTTDLPDTDTPPVDTDTGEATMDPLAGMADWQILNTIPVDRGWEWAIDWDWDLENHTVPTIWLMPSGQYGMFATDMGDIGSRYLWRSDDGLNWAQDRDPIFTPETFDDACAPALLDNAVIHLPDGRIRAMVEGFDHTQDLSSIICSAVTEDGESWTIEEPRAVFDAHADDTGWTSVLEVLWHPAREEYLLYYVGGGYTLENADNIHLATSPDGESFTHHPEYNGYISRAGGVDPDPVLVEDGSIRLYYTRDHPGGNIGLITSPDGVTYTDEGDLLSLQELGPCDQGDDLTVAEGSMCMMDPFFVRLPGDQLVLYFTAFQRNSEGQSRGFIRRAFAAD